VNQVRSYFGKRVIDAILALAALIVLSPLMLIVATIIKLHDRGPIIFKHQRVGQNGRLFWFMKFRSMPVNTANVPSADGAKLRVTPIGRIIRRTSIDELPQLINILRGEMSIVGPRPAIPAQVHLLGLRRENGAEACRPGLTGLAQINSYDGMTEDVKAEWDGRYAARISLATDIKIIFKTFAYLLKPPPVY
jgi:O-antigen biosynthesis protein WbqP